MSDCKHYWNLIERKYELEKATGKLLIWSEYKCFLCDTQITTIKDTGEKVID